jgi:hypothetical protein
MIASRAFDFRAVAPLILGLSASCVFGANVRAATESSASTATSLSSYSLEAVVLVVLILCLLALLFWLLLQWSHRLDQASYLGDVYRESVQDFEYKRLASGPLEKFQTGGYQKEIAEDSEWLKESRKPEPPPGLIVSRGWGTGDGSKSPDKAGGSSDAPDAAQSAADRQAELQYYRDLQEWQNKVTAEASARSRRDLNGARLRAEERAKYATDVDLSVLRGRGAEFVLEFTTVVVIIFAALILGVLRILGTEQIGTLLAAIAGYVLGRATTRAAGTRTAEPPARAGEEKKDKSGIAPG